MILVYDVNVERVNKVCKFLRRFLNWVQNSVFEGELTESEFLKIVNGLKEIIDENEDSVIFYILKSDRYLKKVSIGSEKADVSNVI